MENYKLEENEVVLYKGSAILDKEKGTTELILTNLNLVLITTKKKLFSEPEVTVKTYPMEQVKVYQNTPQIIRKDSKIEVYFLNGETEFSLTNNKEAKKFSSVALELVTGRNTLERTFEKTVDKSKHAIGVVDDKLGIDSVDMVKKGAKNIDKIAKTINTIAHPIKALGNIKKKK